MKCTASGHKKPGSEGSLFSRPKIYLFIYTRATNIGDIKIATKGGGMVLSTTQEKVFWRYQNVSHEIIKIKASK